MVTIDKANYDKTKDLIVKVFSEGVSNAGDPDLYISKVFNLSEYEPLYFELCSKIRNQTRPQTVSGPAQLLGKILVL